MSWSIPHRGWFIILCLPLDFCGFFDSTLHLQFGQYLRFELILLPHSVQVSSSSIIFEIFYELKPIEKQKDLKNHMKNWYLVLLKNNQRMLISPFFVRKRA